MQSEEKPDNDRWIPLLREALPPPFTHPGVSPYTSGVISVEKAIGRALQAKFYELNSTFMGDIYIDPADRGLVHHYADEQRRKLERNKQQQDALPEDERVYQHMTVTMELEDWSKISEIGETRRVIQ